MFAPLDLQYREESSRERQRWAGVVVKSNSELTSRERSGLGVATDIWCFLSGFRLRNLIISTLRCDQTWVSD